jgi:hypothetical protein
VRGLRLVGLLLALASAGSAACKAGNGDGDPLSADAIDSISQEEGDAEGTEWSGTYLTTFTLLSCDCPTVELQMGGMPVDFDICEAVDFAPNDGSSPATLLQTDGLLLFTLEDAGQMTGPIQSNGEFSVGSRVNLDSLVFENEFLGRIDGELDDDDGPAHFTALYQQRVVAEYLGEDIDCRAKFDLDGTRS